MSIFRGKETQANTPWKTKTNVTEFAHIQTPQMLFFQKKKE